MSPRSIDVHLLKEREGDLEPALCMYRTPSMMSVKSQTENRSCSTAWCAQGSACGQVTCWLQRAVADKQESAHDSLLQKPCDVYRLCSGLRCAAPLLGKLFDAGAVPWLLIPKLIARKCQYLHPSTQTIKTSRIKGCSTTRHATMLPIRLQ